MRNLLLLIQIILGSLPFILLAFFSHKTNLDKDERIYQYPMIGIVLVYVFLVSVFIDPILVLLLKFIEFIGRYLSFVLWVNWTYGILYFANFAILVGFLFLKWFLVKFFKALLSRYESLHLWITDHFYEYSKLRNQWLLLFKWHQLRDYLYGFYTASIVVSSLLFIILQFLNSMFIFRTPFYPVYGIMLLGEVVFYLSGFSQVDAEFEISGEDSASEKIVKYENTYNQLKEMFGPAISFDHFNLLNQSDTATSFDTLEKMITSDSSSIRSIGHYFQRLSENGMDIDINYVQSSLNLLYGKSVFVMNPFYKDFTEYLIFPMLKQLLSYHKVAVITGRDGSEEEVIQWIREGISRVTNVSSLWTVDLLSELEKPLDIAIIPEYQLYNSSLMLSQRNFLSEVSFIVLIEPSLIIGTAQMGMTMLVKNLREDITPTFCIFDRNGDGLVDTLSHVLKTNITEVVPTLNTNPEILEMHWKANAKYLHLKLLPNVARYLGVGSEIGLVGLQNAFTDIEWYGGSKFPTLDMKWIIAQYYQSVKGLSNVRFDKDSIHSNIQYSSTLFNRPRNENAYLIIEDEFRNAFEIERLFSTRIKEKGFLNIISEDYLLRDYMVENFQTFKKDPKAIPLIVPDFARTERNTVLRLVMMMMTRPVSEVEIQSELILIGIEETDIYNSLLNQIQKYSVLADFSIKKTQREEYTESGNEVHTVSYFSIDHNEVSDYISILKNSFYIIEDEVENKNLIGAKLYGHVFQSILPSQFITLQGKYYEVVNVTKNQGIILRRASDHLDGRHYYHQNRLLTISEWRISDTMGSRKKLGDIEVIQGYSDFKVDTYGYLDMVSNNAIQTAKQITINGIPQRNYRNKSTLMLKFNGMSERSRFTITLLLNEIFKSIYPENIDYLNIVTFTNPKSDDILSKLLYSFEGEIDHDGIYIFEDSEIDLGLISSIERNIHRYLEMVTEFLAWNEMKFKEVVPDEPKPLPEKEEEKSEELPEKVSFWKKITKKVMAGLEFFRKFIKKKGNEISNEPITTVEPLEINIDELEDLDDLEGEVANDLDVSTSDVLQDEENTDQGIQSDPVEQLEESSKETDLEFNVDETFSFEDIDIDEDSIVENDVEEDETDEPENMLKSLANNPNAPLQQSNEDEETSIENKPAKEDQIDDLKLKKTLYQQEAYILYGMEMISSELELDETLNYLKHQGFGINHLSKARESTRNADMLDEYIPHRENVHYCDFCYREMSDNGYDVLNDGRERCSSCSQSAINSLVEFKQAFLSTRKRMEKYFGISINLHVDVKLVDAKKMAKISKVEFNATSDVDSRVLGLAIKHKKGYTLYLESGSPYIPAVSTIVHELTHIWQFQSWKDEDINRMYGKDHSIFIYEGMAKWAQIHYLIGLNEFNQARREEILTLERPDEYGLGYRLFSEYYPLHYHVGKLKDSPFNHSYPILPEKLEKGEK